MRCLRLPVWIVLVTLIFLLGALPISAKNGRDFSGFYTVTNVVDQGNQVLVTLHVRLFNHSDADVQQAVVALREGGGGQLGTFHVLKTWRNGSEVRLIQQFVVPKRELQNWQHGGQPALMVVTHDANGQRYDRFVQMSRRAVLAR
jgi:hypothetical protein